MTSDPGAGKAGKGRADLQSRLHQGRASGDFED